MSEARVRCAQEGVMIETLKRDERPVRLFNSELFDRRKWRDVVALPMDHQDLRLLAESAQLIGGIVAIHDFPQGRC